MIMSGSAEETSKPKRIKQGSGGHRDSVSSDGVPATSDQSNPPDSVNPQLEILHDHAFPRLGHPLLPTPPPHPDEESSASENETVIRPEDLKRYAAAFPRPQSREDDMAVISHKGVLSTTNADEQRGKEHGFKPKSRTISGSVTNIRPESRTNLKGWPVEAASLKTLFMGKDHQLQKRTDSLPSLQALHKASKVVNLTQLKDGIMPAKDAESRWSTAYHRLSRTLASDQRFVPRPFKLYDKDKGSDSEDDEFDKLAIVTAPKPMDISKYTPYQYNERPFRTPKLGKELGQDLEDFEVRDGRKQSPYYGYKLEPFYVESRDWSSMAKVNHADTNIFNKVKKWNCPEPSPDHLHLPVNIDPLVKYKLRRREVKKQRSAAGGGDQFLQLPAKKPTKEELNAIQKSIELGISPSGRKLLGYDSDDVEEKVFKRVQCLDDPDFDVLQPTIDFGRKGTWPNPYLYYYNWKPTEEDVDEHRKPRQHRSNKKARHILERKRRVADKLLKDPMKIPFYMNDSDSSDPDDDTDPLIRRYPHLFPKHHGHCWNAFYQIRKLRQAHRREMHRLGLSVKGKYHTGCCCGWTKHPMWYLLWKKCIRPAVRRIPRKYKILSEKKTKTLFYGTMASLYQTQYIAEYDLLPNMNDPVMMSQIALSIAIEIKQQFLVTPKDGKSSPYVDYVTMQRSHSYQEFFECIGLLCRYQPIKMPPKVRKVFFLNYFNVLSIMTQIRRIPEVERIKYLWEMPGFLERTKGLAGFHDLSLEEIYHGILRCNRVVPQKQMKVFKEDPLKGFPKEMSKGRLPLKWFDARIHFALNIGTKSCPPIMIFSLFEHDCQLDECAKAYLRERIDIDEEGRTVTLPVLCLWYEKDFGANQRVMLWFIKRFLDPKDMLKIRRLITSPSKIRIRYERFDQRLEPEVFTHPAGLCKDQPKRKKIIPEYWGHRF